jgi:hypothetical protein
LFTPCLLYYKVDRNASLNEIIYQYYGVVNQKPRKSLPDLGNSPAIFLVRGIKLNFLTATVIKQPIFGLYLKIRYEFKLGDKQNSHVNHESGLKRVNFDFQLLFCPCLT